MLVKKVVTRVHINKEYIVFKDRVPLWNRHKILLNRLCLYAGDIKTWRYILQHKKYVLNNLPFVQRYLLCSNLWHILLNDKPTSWSPLCGGQPNTYWFNFFEFAIKNDLAQKENQIVLIKKSKIDNWESSCRNIPGKHTYLLSAKHFNAKEQRLTYPLSLPAAIPFPVSF